MTDFREVAAKVYHPVAPRGWPCFPNHLGGMSALSGHCSKRGPEEATRSEPKGPAIRETLLHDWAGGAYRNLPAAPPASVR